MKVNNKAKVSSTSEVESPKYNNPKILLMDMEKQVEDRLKQDGFNIASGSFGQPFEVEKSDSYIPLSVNGSTPPYMKEKHIVVIDVKSVGLNGSREEPHSSPQEKDWWVKCSQGVIDPRPRLMAQCQDTIDLIINSGGVCVVFAHPLRSQDILWSDLNQIRHGGYGNPPKQIEYNNWSFSSVFDNYEIPFSEGEEIIVNMEFGYLSKMLQSFLPHTKFNCTFESISQRTNRWFTFAEDKFGNPVCGVISTEKNNEEQGHIFVFPRIENKAEFLSDFLKNFLPNLSPQLFPEFEGATWLHNHVYELPQIQKIQDQIVEVEKESRKKVESLNKEIEETKQENEFLYDLLSGTGDVFVDAVQKTLQLFGFQQVVDVDKVLEAEGITQRDGDLQIHDASPILLIEAKGIGGMPSDEDVLAVEKYLITRMKEWKRVDVNGLAIINHQRHIPGLERNKYPFRDKLIENAEGKELGLLTGWNLYRLARGFLKNNWGSQNVKPLLYRSGQIEPLPCHYEYIGVIEGFIENIQVVGIKIEEGEICEGDRIAFELLIDFEEQEVGELQENNSVISQGNKGMIVGMKTHLSKTQAKEKRRVFRVTTIEADKK